MSKSQGRVKSNSISSLDSVDESKFEDFVNQDTNVNGTIEILGGDLENQLIYQAGGKRENVCGFLFKFCLLMGVVFGSGILIFYAL